MSVNIQFDGNQEFQTEAVSSVVDLFADWVDGLSEARVASDLVNESDALLTESFFVNPWGIDDETLLENVKRVQSRTRLDRDGQQKDIIPEDLRLDYDDPGDLRDFAVEMETGTGKTYVYLRTAFELFINYKVGKFVIVVPSIAIREGVLSSLRLMKSHFQQLYPEVSYDSYVYDSKNLSRLRQFATSSNLQILVMNIQAFNTKDRIINTAGERGYKPIEFITSVRPVVILDEPQKLDSKKATKQKEAISSLNALFRLRYSATHLDRHCLVYRLSPVDAYEMKLVKQIQVLSMSAEDDGCSPYVEVTRINSTPTGLTATVLLNLPHKPKVRKTVSRNSSLAAITESDIYKDWTVEDIVQSSDEGDGYVEFTNGRRLRVAENNDSDRDWWQKAQIQAAIESHFETERKLQERAERGEIKPTKPLTLFFIDKVANYYPADAKFKIWFEEIFNGLATSRNLRNLNLFDQGLSAKDLHRGYFAISKKGEALDSNGDAAEDKEAYNLIMKMKERLLSFDEPVRFIFSHSALQEGWDNPNVFTICNLQEEVKSEAKRRQQLGRGLRLPVMSNGERCKLPEANILTVIAAESFESYASQLQKDFEDETGEKFGQSRIKNARARKALKLREEQLESELFQELWKRISPKTHYKLKFDTEDIISEAAQRLNNLIELEPISRPKVLKTRNQLTVSQKDGVGKTAGSIEKVLDVERPLTVPDILGEISRRVPLSRSTIYKVIRESNTEHLICENPASYMDRVRRACNNALGHTLKDKDGIFYYSVGDNWEADAFFRQSIPESYEDNLVVTSKSIFDSVPCDSLVERRFAEALESDSSVKLFLKLPGWFKVSTPLGNYNPDWAIVKEEDGELHLYMIRETKGTDNPEDLFREAEKWKVSFGSKHFQAISVDYEVTSKWSASQ